MLSDASLAFDVPTLPGDEVAPWRRAQWTPKRIAQVVEGVADGADALAAIADAELLTAWQCTLAEFRDPESSPRRRLDPYLTHQLRLSPAGLQAALKSILDGVSGASAEAVFVAAQGRRCRHPLGIVLASNIPALAVQALLPALALRRPVILKSSSQEPCLTALLVDQLVSYEPRLRPALAALVWPGGHRELEEVFLHRVSTVIAYGGGPAMDDLSRRAAGKLIAFGPKISLAVLGDDVLTEAVGGEDDSTLSLGAGLARDIALFEQRGCLSVQAVAVVGGAAEDVARSLADALAAALRELAMRWPMDPEEEVAALRSLRDEATMRGLYQPSLHMHEGTVVVEEAQILEPRHHVQPSPGGRCVRIYPLADGDALLSVLDRWRGQLQGAALAGHVWSLETALRDLGVSRCAFPGELQQPDASWHNGGVSLLEALAEGSQASST